MEKYRLLMDCDPGHDDATALIMAARHPKFDLVGVTTVRGNQTLAKTTNNALKVLQHLNIDVPVAQGCDNPMVKDNPYIPDNIHGVTGLDGPVFEPLTRTKIDMHGIDFIIETCLKSEKKTTITITGPCTNLAMAIRKEPEILKHIEQVVVMGGAINNGNTTPAAEFNIYTDPEAAHIVFNSGLKVTMIGLDVTRKVMCYPSVVDRMGKIGNKASQLFADMMVFFNKTQKEVFGYDGGPLHDPTTVAYLIDPDCFKTQFVNLEVDLSHGCSYGRTNCDVLNQLKREPNVNVAYDVDVERFWDIVEECLRNYD